MGESFFRTDVEAWRVFSSHHTLRWSYGFLFTLINFLSLEQFCNFWHKLHLVRLYYPFIYIVGFHFLKCEEFFYIYVHKGYWSVLP